MSRRIFLIIHNVRSCYNVGSLLRTADAMDVEKVFMTGYTPYPKSTVDERPPHIVEKLTNRISKTALGAENSVDWQYKHDIFRLLSSLKKKGIAITALEQTDKAVALPEFSQENDIVLIVGREVEGLEPSVLEKADFHLEIPMLGRKESLNVASAAAIALYHLRHISLTLDRGGQNILE